MRRWLIILAAILAAAVAAAALLPWWLGFALAQVGPKYGLTVQRYERHGYRHFTVRGVEYRRGPVQVKVDEVTATTPLVWLAQHGIGEPDPVIAGRWSTVVAPAPRPTATTTPRGWAPLRVRLSRIARELDRWIPRAEVGPGTVRWRNGELSFASVRWADRTLVTPNLGYRALHVAVEARFLAENVIAVHARDDANALTATLRGEGRRVFGELTWAAQPARLDVEFKPVGWMPVEAHLRAAQWQVPAARAKLGAHYESIRGHGTVDWVDGALTTDVAVEGTPRTGDPAPPLSVRLRGAGRKGAFVAEAFDVRLPGITAELSDPVVIDRTLHLRSAASRFTLHARLQDQPWFPARGELRGEGRILPGGGGIAALEFTVRGEELAVVEAEIAQFSADGRFEWPRLQISALRVRTSDGRDVSASGGWDFRSRELLASRLEGTVARATFSRWLPVQPRFSTATISATASGTWPAVQHAGRLQVENFTRAPLVPLELDARWSGRGLAIGQFSAEGSAEGLKLHVEGSADAAGARVTVAQVERSDHPTLGLVEPFTIQWRPALTITPMRLTGGSIRLEAGLRWRAAGAVDLTATQVTADWLRAFVALPVTPWTVQSLRLHGEWDQSPATFTTDARIALPLGEGRSAQVSVQLSGDGRGVEIKGLRVGEGEGVVVDATGRVPLVFHPTRQPFVVLETESPFALDATTTANPGFWTQLTELTGVDVAAPEAQVHLKGTLAHPRGEAQFRADRIAPVPGRFSGEWPRIERVDVRLAGDKDGVRLDHLLAAIDGQQVRAEGWVPVAASRWAELIRNPRSLAEHGDLHVEVPDADLRAIARYVPAYLAPTGRLQLDLTLRADQTLRGFVRILDAASRPLGPLGVLQDVQADVRFEGRTVRLEQVTARMAGQVVELRGRADLPAYEPPRLDFTLQGQNLPFVRRTGLLVRGDLDLTLKTRDDDRTEIGGEVRLRDSLFVADVRALLPSGTKGAPVRPPYFSIEAEPLNSWRLAVNISGERFMRLRTPVFNGTASARVRLDGTLGNPRATGQAVIDEGTIRLPFASFEVRQGEVRLSPEEPDPQLLVNGTTRRYGYDLRLELTGPASTPNLVFSSSPPLEAEQVLLMVMAGQAPHDEVTTTDRQRMARFGAFFGQSLLGTLGGDSTGADRLTISSGENISAQGRETYNIEYRLNDRWALTGEYDEFDEYYGGAKWRIYQKGGRKSHAAE